MKKEKIVFDFEKRIVWWVFFLIFRKINSEEGQLYFIELGFQII